MSEGVTVLLHLTLKPEAVEGFCDNIKLMIQDTANFPGFQAIKIVRQVQDPNQVMLIETWDSEEAYGKYTAWRTEQGAMELMAQIVAAPPSLTFWPTVIAQL